MKIKRLSETELRKQIRTARAQTLRIMQEPWWPIAVTYDRAADRIDIGLRSGAVLGVPRASLHELKGASTKQVEAVKIEGEALRWDELDIDISLPGLVRELLGPELIAREAGRIGGGVRSKAKAAAARANGAKGGRPQRRATS